MSDAIKQDSGKPQFSIEQIRARRKRDCALGYRLFAAQKWGDLGDGHISARDPERTDCFWMLRYGVSDLRSFFENDLRFLKQFNEAI